MVTISCTRTVSRSIRSAAAGSALAVLLAATGAATAQQTAPTVVMDDAELITARATVQSVDVAKRTITLTQADGSTRTLKVGEQVRTLAEVKPNDVVKVAFYQSVALDVRQPGAGGTGVSVAEVAARAKPHSLPGGAVVEQMAYTSEIVGIEAGNNDLIVLDPNGKVDILSVQDPNLQAVLPTLKVGDKIDVVITEALAVAVDPAK